MDRQRFESLLVTYLVKAVMIFYFSSVFFFPETMDPMNNMEEKRSAFFLLRLIILVVFSVALLSFQGNLFKIFGFSLLIVGGIIKAIMIVSQTNFSLVHFLILSDPAIVMGISAYYLYRHNLKMKDNNKHLSRKIISRRLEKVINNM
jgi:hypothetical protein